MAIVQLRNPTPGRDYYDRRRADGQSSLEAVRALKRRLSDIVYRTMLEDYTHTPATSPGGQTGNDSDSSATGPQPNRHFGSGHSRTRPKPAYDSLQDRPLTQRGAISGR